MNTKESVTGRLARSRRFLRWNRQLSGLETSLERPGTSWLILAAGMIVSIAVTLYFGRGTTFSGDEVAWVVTSPNLDLQTALYPHGGHLELVSRVTYSVLLNVFGLDYLPYRLLTAVAVCLTSGLLFAWLSSRVPRVVALVPCFILLFFGSDPLHALQGNGFTVLLAISLGLAALLALQRDDHAGDLAASVLLVFL